MRKILPLMVCLGALAGCGLDPATGLVATGATAASYSTLGKGPMDYTLSRLRHRDCDARNLKKYGAYCIDALPSPPAPGEEDVYCYATLGTPYCSRQLDPYHNRNQPIDGSRLILTPSPKPSCFGNAGSCDSALPVTNPAGSGPVLLQPVRPPPAKGKTPTGPVHGPPIDPALQGS